MMILVLAHCIIRGFRITIGIVEWPAGALGGASDALNYIIKEPSTTQSCKDLPALVPLNQVCKWSSIPAQGQG